MVIFDLCEGMSCRQPGFIGIEAYETQVDLPGIETQLDLAQQEWPGWRS